jgi:phosphoserine phosphatase
LKLFPSGKSNGLRGASRLRGHEKRRCMQMRKSRFSRFLALAMAFLIGAATPQALAAITAKEGTTKVMLNGKQLSATAYEINDNNYFKLRDLLSALDIGVDYDAATDTATIDPTAHYKASSTELITGNWATETRAAIQNVINANKNQNKYVVFDFDNTSVINDVEEALLVYQIETLDFAIQPDGLYDVLKTQIPDMNAAVGKNNAGQDVSCEQLAQDIVADYTVLYNSYAGLGGTQSLDAVHQTAEYQDFAAKLRYMYSAVGDTFDASVSYPWVTYLFSGMTPTQVRTLASASHHYWSEYGEFTEETWTSPATGQAGEISTTYLTGITFTDELTDLYQTLMANGIDVYICSASFIDVILAAACDPAFGYNLPEDHVYAMQLKMENGVYIPEYNYDYGGTGLYAQTQAAGKSTVIRNFLLPKYNGAGPIMVFGDSAGDYNMMTDFPETQLGVIFNRYRKPSDPIYDLSVEAANTIGSANPHYVLQGRDNNTGELIPTQYSRMLGSDELVLVRSK